MSNETEKDDNNAPPEASSWVPPPGRYKNISNREPNWNPVGIFLIILMVALPVTGIYYLGEWLFDETDEERSERLSQKEYAHIAMACIDKIKEQLTYPAEADFYLMTGVKVTPEFTGITFDAKNAFGMKTEYYGF